MAHSQRMRRDHAQKWHQPHIEVSEIAEQMEQLLSPTIDVLLILDS